MRSVGGGRHQGFLKLEKELEAVALPVEAAKSALTVMGEAGVAEGDIMPNDVQGARAASFIKNARSRFAVDTRDVSAKNAQIIIARKVRQSLNRNADEVTTKNIANSKTAEEETIKNSAAELAELMALCRAMQRKMTPLEVEMAELIKRRVTVHELNGLLVRAVLTGQVPVVWRVFGECLLQCLVCSHPALFDQAFRDRLFGDQTSNMQTLRNQLPCDQPSYCYSSYMQHFALAVCAQNPLADANVLALAVTTGDAGLVEAVFGICAQYPYWPDLLEDLLAQRGRLGELLRAAVQTADLKIVRTVFGACMAAFRGRVSFALEEAIAVPAAPQTRSLFWQLVQTSNEELVECVLSYCQMYTRWPLTLKRTMLQIDAEGCSFLEVVIGQRRQKVAVAVCMQCARYCPKLLCEQAAWLSEDAKIWLQNVALQTYGADSAEQAINRVRALYGLSTNQKLLPDFPSVWEVRSPAHDSWCVRFLRAIHRGEASDLSWAKYELGGGLLGQDREEQVWCMLLSLRSCENPIRLAIACKRADMLELMFDFGMQRRPELLARALRQINALYLAIVARSLVTVAVVIDCYRRLAQRCAPLAGLDVMFQQYEMDYDPLKRLLYQPNFAITCTVLNFFKRDPNWPHRLRRELLQQTRDGFHLLNITKDQAVMRVVCQQCAEHCPDALQEVLERFNMLERRRILEKLGVRQVEVEAIITELRELAWLSPSELERQMLNKSIKERAKQERVQQSAILPMEATDDNEEDDFEECELLEGDSPAQLWRAHLFNRS